MKNKSLSDLRAAAVHWVASDGQTSASGEKLAYHIAIYKASNLRVTEITLYDTNWDAIKAHTYFALHRDKIYAFEVDIFTDDLERRLLRIDSEQSGYDNAIKTLTEFLSKH
jgi:hypothetical protein